MLDIGLRSCSFGNVGAPGESPFHRLGGSMIAFISDLHIGAAVPLLPRVEQEMTPSQRSLTPLQLQLPAGAVDGFYDDLTRLARDAEATQVTLVLLGDIFDFIQTRVWLNRSNGQPQVWQDGDPEEDQVAQVMAQIAWDNRAFFHALARKKFLSWLDDTGTRHEIPLQRIYIPGNHDRLCNKHPRGRRFIDRILGLDRPVADAPFEWKLHDLEHRVLARHGHVFDEENYAGHTLADREHLLTPVGDLLTTEIASTLPDRMTAILDKFSNPPSAEVKAGLTRDLEAMFSVPGLGALTWFWKRVVRRWRGGKAFVAAVMALAVLLWRFARRCVQVPRWFGRSWAQNVLWALRATIVMPALSVLPIIGGIMYWRVFYLSDPLGIVLIAGLKAIVVLCLGLLVLWGPVVSRQPDRWLRHGAKKEARILGSVPAACLRYIVYGHTHHPVQELLTVCPDGSKIHYLNSGTWRQIIDLAEDNSEFASHKALTYVVVYGDAEQATRVAKGYARQHFECWTGALRDDECF